MEQHLILKCEVIVVSDLCSGNPCGVIWARKVGLPKIHLFRRPTKWKSSSYGRGLIGVPSAICPSGRRFPTDKRDSSAIVAEAAAGERAGRTKNNNAIIGRPSPRRQWKNAGRYPEIAL